MNKIFTQSSAYRPPADWQSQKRPTATDRWHLLDLPDTRVWHPATISQGNGAARVGWLPRSVRYVALAAFVIAGGVALATYQRSIHHGA